MPSYMMMDGLHTPIPIVSHHATHHADVRSHRNAISTPAERKKKKNEIQIYQFGKDW